MLNKQDGKINEIVYHNTSYYNGKYRYFPTITDLKCILDEIINANSTTNYIRITPFYINELLDMQIEFEEYIFFIECRDWFDEKIQEEHIIDCLHARFSGLYEVFHLTKGRIVQRRTGFINENLNKLKVREKQNNENVSSYLFG